MSGTTTAGVDRDPDVVYEVAGQYNRIGVDIDPETGLLIAGKKSAITVRLSSIGATIDPETGERIPGNVEPKTNWIIQTTDITGAPVKARASIVMIDRSLGMATILFKM